MKRAEMRELGAGGQVQKLDRLRQLQERRCGEQEIVRQREDGADHAVGCVLVGTGAGRLLLCGCGVRLWCSQGGGSGEVGINQPGLNSRRGASDLPVEMPERQRKLDRERKQRQPRASPDVVSKPLHVGLRLAPGGRPSTIHCYIITSEGDNAVNRC